MSSGPVGLDAREYVYQVFRYTTADALLHTVTTRNVWLVTRVQFFAADEPVSITLADGSTIFIAAGGCVCLEPNGAFRGPISFGGGVGAVLIVEFWFQAKQSGNPVLPVVSP